MTLTEEIVSLEASLPDVKATRKANGIPALDGCPTPWLERYVAELRRLAAPPPVLPETDLQRRSREIDEWWREQTLRKPKRFQVWRRLVGAPVRLLSSHVRQKDAVAAARGDRPSVVYDGLVEVLVCRHPHGEAGKLAMPAAEQRLRRAVDGTPLRRLRITRKKAQELAAQIGGMRISIEGKKAVVRIDPQPESRENP